MHSLLPIGATRSSYLNLRDMVSLIFAEEYITGSSSICNFLQPLYFLALMTKYLLQQPILEHLSLGFDIQ